jgi:hypothetical protein
MDEVWLLIELVTLVVLVACLAVIFAKAGYPWWTAVFLLVPILNLGWLLYFTLLEWPIERRLRCLQQPETDDGSESVAQAVRFDQRGEWSRAIAAFNDILGEPRYRLHHEYAQNSIREIKRKQSLGSSESG